MGSVIARSVPFVCGKLCIKLNYYLFTMNKQTVIITCDKTNADNKVRLVARIKW